MTEREMQRKIEKCESQILIAYHDLIAVAKKLSSLNVDVLLSEEELRSYQVAKRKSTMFGCLPFLLFLMGVAIHIVSFIVSSVAIYYISSLLMLAGIIVFFLGRPTISADKIIEDHKTAIQMAEKEKVSLNRFLDNNKKI